MSAGIAWSKAENSGDEALEEEPDWDAMVDSSASPHDADYHTFEEEEGASPSMPKAEDYGDKVDK